MASPPGLLQAWNLLSRMPTAPFSGYEGERYAGTAHINLMTCRTSATSVAGIEMILSVERTIMPNLLLRDLDDELLSQLKASARAHGRSLQAEIHDILRKANVMSLAETRRLSASWMRRLRATAPTSDSTTLIREDRDRR
jgi:plasmid stability protein